MRTDETSWPDLAGRLDGSGHVLPIRVYFEDTDFSGAVYHASYLRFLERGRSDFLRLIGVHHRPLAEEGLVFAVRHLAISFERAARIDDVLEVRTGVADLGGARVVLRQAIQRDGDLVTSAEVTVALLSADGRPKRFPATLRQLLSSRLDLSE
ncbi:MAG: tol-pal system-associated acyl-CoA thioesterase [Bauldia sp.]